MNQLTIVGFIGRTAECKATSKGTQVTRFSVATKETWKSADGSKNEATTWHNIVAYGEGYAKLATWLTKGAQVLVQGRLNIDSYEREVEAAHNKKTVTVKVKQTAVECVADTIRLLDRKAKQDDSDQPANEEIPE